VGGASTSNAVRARQFRATPDPVQERSTPVGWAVIGSIKKFHYCGSSSAGRLLFPHSRWPEGTEPLEAAKLGFEGSKKSDAGQGLIFFGGVWGFLVSASTPAIGIDTVACFKQSTG